MVLDSTCVSVCSAYPIRLVGSPVPSAGRLEIQINGTWGSVCSYGVSGRHYTSMIACRQLGFGVPLRLVFERRVSYFL